MANKMKGMRKSKDKKEMGHDEEMKKMASKKSKDGKKKSMKMKMKNMY